MLRQPKLPDRRRMPALRSCNVATVRKLGGAIENMLAVSLRGGALVRFGGFSTTTRKCWTHSRTATVDVFWETCIFSTTILEYCSTRSVCVNTDQREEISGCYRHHAVHILPCHNLSFLRERHESFIAVITDVWESFKSPQGAFQIRSAEREELSAYQSHYDVPALDVCAQCNISRKERPAALR